MTGPSSRGPATVRLEQDDARCVAFEAAVRMHGSFEGAPSLVLDRSAFYPESGGQLADLGALDVLDGASPPWSIAVRDVQIDAEGRVHHLVEGPLPPVDARVKGRVDPGRRRLHTALHTAQHMLSRALLELGAGETVSSRLGASGCTIDLDRDGLSEARLAEAESLVQALIDEDRPVRAWFPEPEELAALPLRRAPKAEHARVRVVDVQGFDVSPCGGTHVLHTSEIGVVRMLSSQRYKGGTRIVFSAGGRARGELRAAHDTLEAGARARGGPAAEALSSTGRLQAQLEALGMELGRTRGALAHALAQGGGPGLLWLGEGGVELVRQVAALRSRDAEGMAVVAGPVEGGVHLVVARGPRGEGDARVVWARLAAVGEGRGGGRPERVEGRFVVAEGELGALRARLELAVSAG